MEGDVFNKVLLKLYDVTNTDLTSRKNTQTTNIKTMKMKSFLIGVIIAIFTTTPVIAQLPFVSHTPVFDTTQRNLRQVVLDDDIYELIVECQSSSGSNAEYILDVRIQNDNITCIYFNNGGSLHSGWNDSGYTWSGGGIRWNMDYYGDITSGRAIIQVSYNNGRWQLFTIRFGNTI